MERNLRGLRMNFGFGQLRRIFWTWKTPYLGPTVLAAIFFLVVFRTGAVWTTEAEALSAFASGLEATRAEVDQPPSSGSSQIPQETGSSPNAEPGRLSSPEGRPLGSAQPAAPGESKGASSGGGEDSAPEQALVGEELRARLAQLFVLGVGRLGETKPVRLRAALARVTDTARREAMVKVYWEVVAKGIKTGLWSEYLEQLRSAPIPATELNLARAVQARARWEAERAFLDLRSAQARLAELLSWPGSEPPPLPGDLFLLSEYRTYYEEVYSRQGLPLRIHLLGRTIPLRWREVQAAVAALKPAEDWRVAAVQALSQGKGSTMEFLRAAECRLETELAIVDSLCAYNQEIAEYALSVAGAGLSPDSIAAMLIGRRALEEAGAPGTMLGQSELNRSGVLPPASEGSGTVSPALHWETVPQGEPGGEPQGQSPPSSGWQQLPVPPGGLQGTPSAGGSASPAGPATGGTSGENFRGAIGVQTEPLLPVDGNPPPSGTGPQGELGQPVGAGTEAFRGERDAFRPSLPEQSQPLRRFAGLESLESAVARRMATGWMFGMFPERVAGFGSVSPLPVTAWELTDCLERAGSGDRLAVVQTYWELARLWAKWFLLEDQLALAEEWAVLLFQNSHLPGNAEGFLRLRAWRHQLQAEQDKWERAIVETQSRLGHLLRLPHGTDLFLPSTLPHVGGYDLQWEKLSQSQKEDPRFQRLAVKVAGTAQALPVAVEAIGLADTAWAEELESFYSRGHDITKLLEVNELYVDLQRRWIDQVIEYNRAIAEYADATVSRDVPSRSFAASLILERPRTSE